MYASEFTVYTLSETHKTIIVYKVNSLCASYQIPHSVRACCVCFTHTLCEMFNTAASAAAVGQCKWITMLQDNII